MGRLLIFKSLPIGPSCFGQSPCAHVQPGLARLARTHAIASQHGVVPILLIIFYFLFIYPFSNR